MPAHPAHLIEFPFWERVPSLLAPQAHHLASRLGAIQVSRGLTRLILDYPNILSGFRTTPGSFGEGPSALASGVGVRNPLTVVPTGKGSLSPLRAFIY